MRIFTHMSFITIIAFLASSLSLRPAPPEGKLYIIGGGSRSDAMVSRLIKEAGLEGLRKFVEDFVSSKGLKDLIIMGNSLGGHVALEVDHHGLAGLAEPAALELEVEHLEPRRELVADALDGLRLHCGVLFGITLIGRGLRHGSRFARGRKDHKCQQADIKDRGYRIWSTADQFLQHTFRNRRLTEL